MDVLELKVRAPESDCRGLSRDSANDQLSDFWQNDTASLCFSFLMGKLEKKKIYLFAVQFDSHKPHMLL